jgi:ketosteroid isomerase-like protein
MCATSIPTLGHQPILGGSVAVIRALEHEWVDGQSHNNNRALALIFDDALIYVEYGKLVSKGDYLSRIKWAGPQIHGIALEEMSVQVFGSTAVVVGSYRENSFGSGKGSRVRWRFIDTWVYKKNGWVLVAAAAAPLSN